jgi:hypothetical protein
MRKVLYALLGVGALAAVSTTMTSTPAEAWGGCGPYRHPTPWGCRWNGGYGPGYVVYVGPGWHRPWGWYRPWGWHRHWHRW